MLIVLEKQLAKNELLQFTDTHGHKISALYVEDESDAALIYPQLMQLIDDVPEDDLILIEQIDCLARLNQAYWNTLKKNAIKKSWQS